MLTEGTTWRPTEFRRFVVGTLPDGREERLEFWRHNHLLGPFEELWARRLGVEGVPFFLINSGVAISGAQKPDIIAATLRQAIEAGVS